MKRWRCGSRWLGVAVGAACFAGMVQAMPQATTTDPRAPVPTHYADWPKIAGPVVQDAALDARARKIVAGMTLAQKVGQMTQAEIKSITPAEVREYAIGSVLNGGGSWPQKNKRATIGDWLHLADAYYGASMHTDLKVKLPVIWGTDAVHGDSNVFGATLFPHNVGLGAAHDPALIREIGAATARAVRATGVTWAFAPTLAVSQNARWGRSYESFSSEPGLVREYAKAYIEGLQGDFGPHNVLATAKHFIGDGGTFGGKDQGEDRVDRATMINVHGAGYYGALEAGVASVMASYNSWNDIADHVDYGKMSGAQALLTGVLKDKLGFPGFIVSDWNAIGQLPGCTNASCPQAINAGIDMVMVPDDWKAFIANTIKQVGDGQIPMARIDDAVTRIVRAKLEMKTLFQRPSSLPGAGDAKLLQDRPLARRAVRESLVLLKNNRDVLPLRRGIKLLVVGKSADSLSNQAGGWSLTWQGTDNTNADYPNAESILAGLREADGAANVTYSKDGSGVNLADYDAIVAVIGETPYAEMMGDLLPSATFRESDRYPEDLVVLKRVAAARKPLITVLVAGRPLFVNPMLNLSDAFVMAWLPGGEGGGVGDVLFAHRDGKSQFNFTGTLPRPWPGVPCPGDVGAKASDWLFTPGYGLRYPTQRELPTLPEHADVASCAVASTLPIFHTVAAAPFALYLSVDRAERTMDADLNRVLRWPEAKPAFEVRTVQVNTQQDAKEVAWLAPGRFFARSATLVDLREFAGSHAALLFDVVVTQRATTAVHAFMGCGGDCGGSVDLTAQLAAFAQGTRHMLAIPLGCFAARGVDLSHVEVPFAIDAAAPFKAAFADVRVGVAPAGSALLPCGDAEVR